MATASAAFTFDGAAGSLLKLSTTASATVTATIDSLDGVSTIAWSVASTDESMAPGDYTLTTSGPKGSVVTLTSDAAGTAGILQCRINGGINPQTGAAEAAYTKRAKWHVPTAGGLEVGCIDEAFESDPVYGTTGLINAAVRSVGGGSGVTSVSGTAPIVSSGGATPAISISAASGTGPGSMSTAHWTLCDGATSSATVSTLVKRDASGRFKAVAGVASDDVAVVSQCGGTSWRTTPDAHDLGVWRMDETSGSFLNTGAAGTLSLAPTGTVSHLDEGGLGTGVYMQGAGSYVASADTSLCQPTALTVWSWVRVRKFDSLYPIVIAKLHDIDGAGFNDPYFDYAIEIFPSIAAGKWLVAINVGGMYRAVECGDSNRFSVVVDRPHLLALTYDGTALRAYMDGVEAGNLSAAGSITYGNGRIIRGGHPVSATYGIDGWLGEARVDDQAMTAAQLAEVYRRGIGRWS